MKKIFALALLTSSFVQAQTIGETLDKIGEKIDINLYLRTSYEISGSQDKPNAFKLNESRMEVMGDINENLAFRTRWRMNREISTSTLSNSPSSLDYAYLTYKFGKDKKYALSVGKQMNDFGSWEFYDNPTFEYIYSNYINKQQNLFPVGMELSYKINDQHSIQIQGYNPSEATFEQLHENQNTQYDTNQLEKSKFPIGINLTWKGNLFDNKFRTIYTVTSSQIAKGKNNFQVSLGNKVVLDKFSGYLDVHHTHAAVDYVNAISSSINALQNPSAPIFAKDIVYQSAVLRLNYALTPQWYIMGKSIMERVGAGNHSTLTGTLSTNNINQIALEYKPFAHQDFKLFGFYAHFNSKNRNALQNYAPNSNYGMLGVGALWYVNAL